MTLMLHKMKELSLLRTTMRVEQPLTELSFEAISVHNKVENLQVDLIKVAIDLLLVKVCDSVTIAVDEVSQNLSTTMRSLWESQSFDPLLLPSMQIVPAGQYEAFNELTKILWTKVDKSDISPEFQKTVFGGHLN
ncbi:hypothetical protein PHMEG_00037805 [Phytophthora megakarya]|uniref:Uncharacterized protein n=1 Tax=Phytophthora megakarya TaxID=4795 RepID=A0A225UJ54_9STRA|nr:hypothetical protein PHMEG_00037805 [Phytophthora megakarya]